MLAADISRPLAALLLLQHSDDLLVRKLCMLCSGRLLAVTDSTKTCRKIWGLKPHEFTRNITAIFGQLLEKRLVFIAAES